MLRLNVNTDQLVIFSNKLERISRSAFPVAVRAALNSAAFDVKKNTLIKNTESDFVNRQKNFFKANSKVDQAKGFDLGTMAATVGMTETGLKGSTNYAVKDLEQQEEGGTIKSKSFIPMLLARSGIGKPVRPSNRLSAIKNIVNSSNFKGVSDKQKFVAAVHSAGAGGLVLAKIKGKEKLWRVNSVSKNTFSATPLYSHQAKRSVRVRGRHFMKRASLSSGSRLEEYYIKAAENQFSKVA